MAKRVKKRTKPTPPSEARSMEVLTIGWMLMVCTTLVCELGFAAARAFATDTEGPMQVLAVLLLFAAMIIGIIALLVTPVVVRGRREPPPGGITAFAVVVAAAPVALVALELLAK